MRKTISLLLVTALLISGSMTVFAADTAAPSDVQGTKYEEAVKVLVDNEIVKGYSDGTFRPDRNIDRAELCTIIVNAMKPGEADLKAAPAAFSDITAEYNWALQLINYGAANNIVSGYGNGLFKPSAPVTYNEMATMLVKALGFSDKDLAGTYPDSYAAKAKELGMLKDVDITGKGDTAANRGDMALMTASIAKQLIDKYQKDDPTDTPSDTPTTGGGITTGSSVTSDNDNPIFNSAGGAFGMINTIASVVDKDGNRVSQIEFLMGGQTYYLNTKDSKVVPNTVNYDGTLYYIKFNADKQVKDIYSNPNAGNPKHYEELTGNAWVDVVERSNRVITITGAGLTKTEVSIMNDAIIYRATFAGDSIDGYEKGSLSDIAEGAKIRAYDVTDDKSDVADVVVYVTKKDAENL